MSQKVNPVGFRTGVFMPWKSRWFTTDKNYKEYLLEDIKIRRALMARLKLAGVVDVEIERLPKSMVLTLTVSRPGVVIGRGGSGLEDVKKEVLKIVQDAKKIDINVLEVKDPETSAQLVATRIAGELERRMPHRRVINRAMERVMQAGARGIKVVLAGRIGGADIARVEKNHMGSVPTQTLRENIDYAQVSAMGKRGYIGVKVWIYKKEEK